MVGHQARRAPRAVARAARAGGAPTAAAHRPLGDAAAARRGRALPGRRRGRARAGGRGRSRSWTPGRRRRSTSGSRCRSRTCPASATLRPRARPATGEPRAEHLARDAPAPARARAAHRSTILFVNSRRLAERLAAALNELAGEEIARAHHGSIAREERVVIEDALKAGRLPALVATSSLELGIDMGAVDLVIQIETPLSVASGMQRIGRASHQVEAVSRGVIFPKFRGDLLATAAITKAMKQAAVEETRVPRNPLDVLAQQLVAIATEGEHETDELYALVRRAAPFASLAARRSRASSTCSRAAIRPTSSPSCARASCGTAGAGSSAPARARSRSWWRTPARSPTAASTASSWPTGDGCRRRRVGELDEEMVFESREGDVFVLGASSWRIVEITRDRVLVAAGAGRAGRDAVLEGRPRLAAGRARPRDRTPHARARRAAARRGARAARAGARLRRAPRRATCCVPGRPARRDRQPARRPHARARAHARRDGGLAAVPALALGRPRARAVGDRARRAAARARRARGRDGLERRRHRDAPARARAAAARPRTCCPTPTRSRTWWCSELAATSLFAARFREAAARALLLPRRRPGQRSPLWMQRKRAHDLLQVAARYPSFPIVLEAYRECLQDVFDLPALVELARRVRAARDPPGHGRHPDAVALRRVAAVRLRRQLPLRRRRAARRAARAGAERRPARAARAPGRSRAARAARPPRARRRSSSSSPGSSRAAAPRAPTGCTTCCCGSATSRSTRWRPGSRRPRARRRSKRPHAWLDALVREHAGDPGRRSPARRASRRPRTPAGSATRSASRCPPGCRKRSSSRGPHALRELVARYARTHGPFQSHERGAPIRRSPRRPWRQALAGAGRCDGPRAGGRVPARRRTGASGAAPTC